MSIENIFSNDSYTEKDFQESYQELVDTIGKLNNKWLIDGEGNESDPGVILVKCIAGAIDKLSYNTDKNILENFPETLKQLTSARRVFSPVYNMKWYRSAVGSVYIQNNNEDSVTIPNYLMLSTDDNSIVYTIINNDDGESIGPGEVQQFTVAEGRIKKLTINGDDKITIDNFIDNKLYLDDYNIAQNGIFVEQYETKAGFEFSSWIQSDNIYVEDWSQNGPNGGKYFEFKIDPATEKPYLQFVDDLVSKIGDGLKIRYILSSGKDGNISAGKLTNVFAADSEAVVQSENLYIVNVSPIQNGKDPETIEEAKRNYFKDIDICNTLVTLRDYINAIYLSEDNLVSNCFVCDKNNDVQYSYSIRTEFGDSANYETVAGIDDLTLYDLKFYGLQYNTIDNSTFTEQQNYRYMFDIINPLDSYGSPVSVPQNVLNYINNIKSINHNFRTIRNANKPCLFKDYYTLHINLLFRQRLSAEQEQEIKNKVYTALLNYLNARAIDFGEKITYEKVQEIIYNTDSRILGASIYGLDDVDFDTFAVYWSPYVSVYYEPSKDSDQVATIPYSVGAVVLKDHADNTKFDLFVSEDQNSWTQYDSVATPNVSDRKYDLLSPTVGINSKLALIYSAEKAWQTEYTSSLSAGDIYICISQPSSEIRDNLNNIIDTVYGVTVDFYANTTTGVSINNYPSTPQKIAIDATDISNGYVIFTWNGADYKATFIKSGSYYQEYLFDNVKEFYYNSGTANNAGQFHEIKINSEITDNKYDENFQIGKDTLVGVMQTDIYAKSVLAGKTNLLDTNSAYHPKLRDQQVQERSGIQYLKPNLNLTLKSEYVLDNNEYIQILTPELETIATYSFYIYMGFYSADKNILSISQNTNYQLKSGEYMIFYYRASDDENYSYTVYNEGNIICPSKTVVLYSLDVNGTIATYFKSQIGSIPGKYYTGVCPDHIQSQVVAATTDTYARNRLTALKSQDSCDVKKQVEASIEKYKFISVEESFADRLVTYTLTFQELNPNKYYRVLEEGESFWVYNNKGTLLKILGSGSIIYKDSQQALSSNGSTLITATDNLSYAGCEIFQIGPGDTVQPVFGASSTIKNGQSSVSVSDSSTAYDGASLITQVEIRADSVTGTLSGGYYTPVLANGDSIDFTGNNADVIALQQVIQSQLNKRDWSTFNGFSGINNDEVTIEVQYINRKVESNKVVDDTKVYFSVNYTIQTQTQLALTSDFQPYTSGALIQYHTSGESTFTIVSNSNIEGFNTLIRSALMVSIDDSSQSIFTHREDDNNNISEQSVFGYDKNGSELLRVSSSTDAEYVVSTDGAVNILGGKQKLSTIMSFYSATEAADVSESEYSVTYGQAGSTQVAIKINAGEYAEVQIPNTTGDLGYILFCRTGTGVKRFSVCNSNTSILESDCYKDLYGNTLYYDNKEWSVAEQFTIKVDDGAESIYIYAQTTDGPEQNFVINMNIVPFSYKKELTYNYYGDSPFNYKAITNEILERMGELDIENKYFIDSNANFPISNPIAAASFLNNNHIFNKYTICQMNTDLEWR